MRELEYISDRFGFIGGQVGLERWGENMGVVAVTKKKKKKKNLVVRGHEECLSTTRLQSPENLQPRREEGRVVGRKECK